LKLEFSRNVKERTLMKKSRFTEEQIIGILKQHEAGMKTADLCREHGISPATFYGWKSKYGGMDVNEAQRLRQMEDESNRPVLAVTPSVGLWIGSESIDVPLLTLWSITLCM